MAGIGDGFAQGLAIGNDIRRTRYARKMAEADRELKKKKMEKDISFMEAEDDMRRKELERRSNDPRELLAQEKARRAMASLDAPQSEDEVLAAEVNRLRMQKEKASLSAPVTQAEPPAKTAKVTQTFGEDGKSRAVFDVPVSEVGKYTGGASAYKSPFASDIADLGREIADHEAEMETGDTHTGFLGLGGSRKDKVALARQKQMRFKALELQDQLEKGVISQEEADKRASLMMGRMK